MKISKNNIGSITYTMKHGIDALNKCLNDAKKDNVDKDYPSLYNKLKNDISQAQAMLDTLLNIECNDDAEMIVKTDCIDCDGDGYIYTNDINGDADMQKCDECNLFDTDDDARHNALL